MAKKAINAKQTRGKQSRAGATEAPAAGAAAETPAALEADPIRANEISKAISAGKRRLQTAPILDRDSPQRFQTRLGLIYREDKQGFERVIGTRDIVQMTFLYQALEAARSVCRIRVRGASPGPDGFGTGFLVAPGVLLTNHHVLETPEAAHLSLVEFNAELNINYVHKEARVFNLLPDRLFVSDPGLDFTFVAVNSLAHDGTPLAEFGHLTLLRESGKGLNGEWATIIQHPGGETKQIVIRENRIVVLPDIYQKSIGPAFLHYVSDTERGSSGSPVLNDQFEVIALHHKTVPKYSATGDILARNGKPWNPGMGEDQMAWIANEGVRISAIFNELDRIAHRDRHAVNLLSLLENGEPQDTFSTLVGRRGPISEQVGEGAELESSVLARRSGKGYQANFLDFIVPLPKPRTKKLKDVIQPLKPGATPKGGPGELVFTHFSIVMHAKRRLAIFAAVNIDGASRRTPTVKPVWRTDGRILRSAQISNELYEGNQLDKGHLVRRLDPVWGDQRDADDAVLDTYHYVNAAPQEHGFNDGVWGDIEDYILQLAEAGSHKISVFTGPVFGEHDLAYRPNSSGGPWLIPLQFWKVIVYAKSDGTRSATGFVVDQSDALVDLAEGFTPLARAREVARVHQRAVQDIEKLSDLDFGPLRTFDPLNELEATKRTRRILMPNQIVI